MLHHRSSWNTAAAAFLTTPGLVAAQYTTRRIPSRTPDHGIEIPHHHRDHRADPSRAQTETVILFMLPREIENMRPTTPFPRGALRRRFLLLLHPRANSPHSLRAVHPIPSALGPKHEKVAIAHLDATHLHRRCIERATWLKHALIYELLHVQPACTRRFELDVPR